MKHIFIFILVFVSVSAFSQEKKSLRPRILASAGVMGGESEARPVYQLGAGLAFGRFYFGAGVARDNYKFESLPVFGDFRFDLNASRKIFSYLNAGHNFPQKIKDRALDFEPSNFRQTGGLYFDLGVGVRIRIVKSNNLLISGGVSWKSLTHRMNVPTACISFDCPDQVIENRYRLGRVTTKISWELW